MGAWSIPLHGTPAPTQNPYQAFAQGQNQALTAQGMVQNQQLTAEQVQAQDMANRQAQIQMQSQAAMRQAYLDSQGDLDKTLQLGAKYGATPGDLGAFQKQRLDLVSEKAKATGEQLTNTKNAHDLLTGQAQAYIGMPDAQKNDPQKWAGYLAQVNKFDPEEVGFAQNNPTYPGDDAFKLHILGLRSGTQIAEDALKLRQAQGAQDRGNAALTNADTRKTESEAKLPGVSADADQKVRSNAAGVLAAAADLGKEDYARAYYQLDPKVAKGFPHPDDYNDYDDPGASIRSLGQTPEQQVTTSAAASRDANTASHQTAMEQAAQVRNGIAAANSARERSQTANSAAIDRRNAEGELRKLEQQEAQLNTQRRTLGAAIKAGTTLKDKNGNDVDAAAQLADVTDQYKSLIADKYNAYGRTGRADPAVSYEDAIKAVDAGMTPATPKALPTPAITPARPATTPPKAVTPPVTKTTAPKRTEADIRAWATANQKDPDGTVKMARSKGLIP